jgi:hypothetical protein
VAVDGEDEAAEIASIALIQPRSMLARNIPARVRNEECAAFLEDDRGSDSNRGWGNIENREKRRGRAHGENGRLRHEFAHFLLD